MALPGCAPSTPSARRGSGARGETPHPTARRPAAQTSTAVCTKTANRRDRDAAPPDERDRARRRVEQRHMGESGVSQRVGERLRHHADAVTRGDADDQLLDARRGRRRRAGGVGEARGDRVRAVPAAVGAARAARRGSPRRSATFSELRRASGCSAGSTATRRSSSTTCDSSVASENGRRTTATSTLPSASAPGPSPQASERRSSCDLRVRVAEVAHEARGRQHGGGVEADPQAALLAARLRLDLGERLGVEREHAASAAAAATRPPRSAATLREVRRSSSTPSWRSKVRIAVLSGGWAIPSRLAARPKWSSSATATK